MRSKNSQLCRALLLLFVSATFAHPLRHASFLSVLTSCQATLELRRLGCCSRSSGERRFPDDAIAIAKGAAAHCSCLICQFHHQGKLPCPAVGLTIDSKVTDISASGIFSLERHSWRHWNARAPPASVAIV